MGKMKKIPLPMTRITFDRIIYPVQTKTGLKYPKMMGKILWRLLKKT